MFVNSNPWLSRNFNFSDTGERYISTNLFEL
jgi:hypothetical protein